MFDTNQPTDELVREMYARFGLAYYFSEALHRSLCIYHAISNFVKKDLLTRPRIEEHMANAFSLTLGGVITLLNGKVPEEYYTKLNEALEKRNFLAHHFWFDRAHLMFNTVHIQGLINELDGYSEVFNRLDEEVSEWLNQQQTELGITDEMYQDYLAHVLSGEEEDPLPKNNVVKELQKKLKGKQRLVRVWDFKLPEGGNPLVFEMQDGTFWQLCDAGLGWTRYNKTEPHWIEHPEVKPFLPADIISRPKNCIPWEYEFKLKKGVVFWVKPGRHPQTFLWGIRKKTEDTVQPTESDK